MFISLPLSKFGMSLSQFILAGTWIIERKYSTRIKQIFSDRIFLILASVFLLHVLGLLWTTDFSYGLKDIRTKIPLLVLPLILVGMNALPEKRIRILFWLYTGSVLVGSFTSTYLLLTTEVSDIRYVFPFISHIRFNLNVVVVFFIAIYFFIVVYRANILMRVISVGLVVWFAIFLILVQSPTGILILVFNLSIISLWYILRKNSLRKTLIFIMLMVFVALVSFFYMHDLVKSYRTPWANDLINLDLKTSAGNQYIHDTITQPVENGSYTGLYIAEVELRPAWNIRSEMDYNGKDGKGQEIKYTLIRYLNSKHLRKDAEGIKQLTEEDVNAIEMGIANCEYRKKFSLKGRLYKTLWEYDSYLNGGNPGGHTLMQRLEFWKVSARIIKDNFLIGVGTGDVQNSFDEYYEKINSPLAPEWRWRAHNQFLSIWIALGVFGLGWFIFSLIYPAIRFKSRYRFIYIMFFLTVILSMVFEDTLETQAGATFFSFINAFLLFGCKDQVNTSD